MSAGGGTAAGTAAGPFTVWLASYPKSGNTWSRAVLDTLTRRGGGSDVAGGAEVDINALGVGSIASSRLIIDGHLGFASSDLLADEIDALRPAVDDAVDSGQDRIHVRKVHDALTLAGDVAPIVSASATRAAIYLVRDPRDVAVSYAHHRQEPIDVTVARMADPAASLVPGERALFLQVRQRVGTWSQHVESWTRHDLFPVAVFRYEDLHADPVGEFGRMAAFAGLPVSRDDVVAAVEAARFDRLRAQESQRGFRERIHEGARFFRRGVVGSWRDELPVELVRRIEADHADVMARYGYPALA